MHRVDHHTPEFRPIRFSTGQRQRIAAAIAGQQPPPVMIRQARMLGDLFQQRHQRQLEQRQCALLQRHLTGSSVLVIAHRLSALRIADRIVTVERGRIVGVEALMRWRREDRLILPADFIPLAEETNLIIPMTEWVTREAMQIHGGMGYAEEYTVSRLFVDARVLSIFEGADETLCLKVIARTLCANA